MFLNIKEVGNQMYKACESTCHECTSKDEVENYKNYIVVEKKELIMKKDMDNKEIIRKNMTIPVHSLKVIYEKAI